MSALYERKRSITCTTRSAATIGNPFLCEFRGIDCSRTSSKSDRILHLCRILSDLDAVLLHQLVQISGLLTSNDQNDKLP